MDRRASLVFLVAAGLTGVPLGVAHAAPAGDSRPAVLRPAAAGEAGDRDVDHLADDLQRDLRRSGSDRRLAVIVTGATSDRARRAVGTFRVRHELPLIDGFAATLTAGQVRALRSLPGLRRIEYDGRVHVLDDGTSADFGATAARADHPGVDGSGVGICVVDTGIDPAHEQIAPRTVTFTDFVNHRTAAYDDHGHGTHVAAIAAGDGTGGPSAGSYIGVAPAADLYAAKVLDASGYGDDSDVVAGIQWCAQQPGVGVISMSLGGGGGDGTDAGSLAVDEAVAAGRAVVVAAGNSGDEPGTVSAPGVARGAITVGAVADHSAAVGTDRHDDGIWLAAFSSRGPTSDGRTKPDIAAPGVSVGSAQAGTTTGYVTYSGTSMATPYVAGAVALGREAAPAATPQELKNALTGTAVDMGPSGTDNDWGAGLVDVRRFVDTLSGAAPARTTAFPVLERFSGTVPSNGAVSLPFTVAPDALGVPIAATVTISGRAICYYACLIKEWGPDLDAELRGPGGTVLARSECALDGLSCGIGRQETIGVRPTVAGTYVLRVYAFTGSPNNGAGGSFRADVSHGPLGGGTTPPAGNQAPTANAGPDQTVRINKKTKVATFTLDGSASTDPDGDALGYQWSRNGAVVSTAARFTTSSSTTGSYTYTLTVTDPDGLADADSTVVTVRR